MASYIECDRCQRQRKTEHSPLNEYEKFYTLTVSSQPLSQEGSITYDICGRCKKQLVDEWMQLPRRLRED